MGTAEFHHQVGRYLHGRARELGRPSPSLLAAAFEADVPIYTSSPGDSSIGMNLAALSLQGGKLQIDTLRDVNETAAIVYAAKRDGGKSGVLILGGGSPKNFILQTEPQIQEVLGLAESGHDYFLQITDARPDTGGLSGATASEAMTWGKVDPDTLPDSVTCYTDSTIALPLLTAYALARHAPRPLRRLYRRRYRHTTRRYKLNTSAKLQTGPRVTPPLVHGRTCKVDPHESGPGRHRQPAARLLLEGGLVAFATETVYGLGAIATEPAAVARIFAAKGRPAVNPLIVHVAGIDEARVCVEHWPDAAECLARRFWPGPLTLVLERSAVIPDVVTAGKTTVAVRVPAGKVARGLIERVGQPIAAPSANRSNRISPTRAEHVLADLDGRIDLIIDSGPTDLGLESTVLDLTAAPPRLLRSGPVPRSELEDALGGRPIVEGIAGESSASPSSPGQMPVHYAPRTPSFRVDTIERAGRPRRPSAARGDRIRAASRRGTSGDDVSVRTGHAGDGGSPALRHSSPVRLAGRRLDHRADAARRAAWRAVRDRLLRDVTPDR